MLEPGYQALTGAPFPHWTWLSELQFNSDMVKAQHSGGTGSAPAGSLLSVTCASARLLVEQRPQRLLGQFEFLPRKPGQDPGRGRPGHLRPALPGAYSEQLSRAGGGCNLSTR